MPRHLRITCLLGLTLLLLSGGSVIAQTYEPTATGFATDFRIWTSGGNTFANVRLTFPNTGYNVSDWGQMQKVGNEFIADAKVKRYTGGSGQAITIKENTYILGAVAPGSYTLTFKSYGTRLRSEQFDPSLVVEHWEPTTLSADQVYAAIWTQEGITYARANFVFPDAGYAVIDWGQITRSGDDFSIDTKVERSTVRSSAHTNIVDRTFDLGALGAGAYTFTIKMYGSPVRSQPFSITTGAARAPHLLTEENSARAIALESVTWMRQFLLDTLHNFSADRRARILLLATEVDVASASQASALSAYAEDVEHRIFPMTIEFIGTVPGLDWLTQVVVRPPDELKAGGEVSVVLSNHGVLSNRVLVNINPSNSSPH